MLNVVSICWPWDHDRFTVKQVLDHLVALNADEVCIRTPAYLYHYDSPTDPTYHDRIVAGARARGMRVSLWPIVSLVNPKAMAASIRLEYDRYEPDRIVLDAERKWVNLYGANTKPFLLELGDASIPCPIGLGSYRRPSLQPQIRWQVWLTTQVNGKYVITFQAAQLYPIGWLQPASVVRQFRLDVDSHEEQHRLAGRPNIEWLPFMPAFTEGLDPYGNPWYPRADAMRAAMDYLVTRLGTRLVGLNWWSLDQDLMKDPWLAPLRALIAGSTEPTPPPAPRSMVARIGYSNVRSGPGLQYAVVGHLTGGQRVDVLEERGGWVRIDPTLRWVSLTRLEAP